VPVAPYTSFGIGGRARYLVDVFDVDSLLTVLKTLRQHRVGYFVLGKGTNLLVADRGYPGALIRLVGDFGRVRVDADRLICGAGALLSTAVRTARQAGLSGLEFACGIPGSLGGAVKMNAGAFGESIGARIKRAWVINGRLHHSSWSRRRLGFSYRRSKIGNGQIVTRVVLVLSPANRKLIARREEDFARWRRDRQPWGLSAGSIFKNPPQISAGRLIEECGLKGHRIGGAVVSRKHANFILNRSKASCRDVKKLIALVKKTVYDRTGVRLVEEVISLG
jgi:UDP-N-acetylmuramate dehydrogenase